MFSQQRRCENAQKEQRIGAVIPYGMQDARLGKYGISRSHILPRPANKHLTSPRSYMLQLRFTIVGVCLELCTWLDPQMMRTQRPRLGAGNQVLCEAAHLIGYL
jgi:hypothetical protein